MPHVHVRPRNRPSYPFVVGMGQIDFGATRVPTGGTTDASIVPKIRVAPNLAIPGYVTSGPKPPPRYSLLDTPATRVAGGPSITNSTPLPTGMSPLDGSIHSARGSVSTPPETADGGQVALTPVASPDGLPVSTDPNSSASGPISVDGTIDVPPVIDSSSYGQSGRFQLPFGLKWWHLAAVGGLAVGAVILMKRA